MENFYPHEMGHCTHQTRDKLVRSNAKDNYVRGRLQEESRNVEKRDLEENLTVN
jgi:hypothetical protein